MTVNGNADYLAGRCVRSLLGTTMTLAGDGARLRTAKYDLASKDQAAENLMGRGWQISSSNKGASGGQTSSLGCLTLTSNSKDNRAYLLVSHFQDTREDMREHPASAHSLLTYAL